jgi:uncharacterized membrane protein YtjA (UPF0391 family)
MSMLRMAWTFLAMAAGAALFRFGTATGASFAPFQLATFLFTVLFLILLILGSPALKNLV